MRVVLPAKCRSIEDGSIGQTSDRAHALYLGFTFAPFASGRRGFTAILLATTLGVLLSACGDDSPAVPQVSGTVSSVPSVSTSPLQPVGPSETQLRQFFTALGSDESTQLRRALKLAAPGSAARAYTEYLYYRALSEEQGGNNRLPQSVTQVAGGWTACPPKKEQGACITFSDIQAKGNLIASYTTNGKDLGTRMVAGGQESFAVGTVAEARFVTAYRSVQSNYTFIVVQVRNGGAKAFVSDSTAYQTPNGTQINNAGTDGPVDFLPHGRAYLTLMFPGAPPGRQRLL